MRQAVHQVACQAQQYFPGTLRRPPRPDPLARQRLSRLGICARGRWSLRGHAGLRVTPDLCRGVAGAHRHAPGARSAAITAARAVGSIRHVRAPTTERRMGSSGRTHDQVTKVGSLRPNRRSVSLSPTLEIPSESPKVARLGYARRGSLPDGQESLGSLNGCRFGCPKAR